jgi:hypothetical protein
MDSRSHDYRCSKSFARPYGSRPTMAQPAGQILGQLVHVEIQSSQPGLQRFLFFEDAHLTSLAG